jgi:hypothetical protein
LLGLCAIAVSFGWLVARAGQTFYVVVVVLFWLQLLSTALASAYVTRGLLLAK